MEDRMRSERDEQGDRGKKATFDRRTGAVSGSGAGAGNNPGSDEGYDSDLDEDVLAPAAPGRGR
jgi:hypothetical protein